MPYVHGTSPNFKKIGNGYDVDLVLTAFNRLGVLCARTDFKAKKQSQCRTRHSANVERGIARSSFHVRKALIMKFHCRVGTYRLGKRGDVTSPPVNLTRHCSRYGCVAILHRIRILPRGKDKTEKLARHSILQKIRGKGCVCKPLSLAMSWHICVGVFVAGERRLF